MLRYVVCGPRNFTSYPDVSAKRHNWEFFAAHKGIVFPVFSDKHIKSAAGSNFWIIPPGTQYYWQSDGRTCRRTVLHFAHAPSVLTEEIAKRRIIALHLSKEELRRVEAIGEELFDHFQNPNQLSLLVMEHAVLELSLLAMKDVKLRPQSTRSTFNRERVERALAWYGEHMHERPSLKQVADAIHLSPSHVRKLFYDTMKIGPKAVFVKMRLERACDILATTSSSLDVVSSQSGFLDAVDFCRVFKKGHLISPGAWRKQVSTHS